MSTVVSPRSPGTELVGPAPVPAAPPHVSVAGRRRRVLAALAAGGLATFLLGFIPGLRPAWWATLGIAALAAAYACLLGHVRQLAARREWDLATAAPVDGWRWEEWEVRLAGQAPARPTPARPTPTNQAPARPTPTRPAPAGQAPARRAGQETREPADPALARPTATLGRWALARFVAAYAAGWLLTPLIVIVEQIAGGAQADSRRRRWLERLLRLQAYGRQQSIKALSLSMVATAGVASFGPLTATAGASGLTSSSIAAAATANHYTVQPGDTLARIAARFGTTVSALAAANGIANPNLIYAGQVIVIADAPASGTAGTSARNYTVQPGDTLARIAARFGTTVSALAAANGIANPNLIYAGQVLRLSGSGAPTSDPAPTPARSYTVQPGDTLARIAARFGTTVSALAAANGIANPNLIYAGQVLRLSGSGASTSDPAPARPPAPAPAPSPAPASTSAAAVAVRVALAQIGKPYEWGGAGPGSFDCSGLVMYAYAAAGIALPHYTVSQYYDTARISESQLQPGDLVFYNTGGGAQPGHVAMYIGGGQVVAANTYGTYVQTQPITWDGAIWGFGRVR